MVTRNRIVRLSDRIDALAGRRWGKLSHNSLTDGGWAKIERLAAEQAEEDEAAAAGDPGWARPSYADWSDDALLRFLIDDGALAPTDFKPRVAPSLCE